MGAPVIIAKEMGLSHRDFFRTVASALGTEEFESTNTGVRLTTDERVLEINLGPERERRIALMVVPITQVTLRFTNYTEADVQTAVKRFDMRFKRGGG